MAIDVLSSVYLNINTIIAIFGKVLFISWEAVCFQYCARFLESNFPCLRINLSLHKLILHAAHILILMSTCHREFSEIHLLCQLVSLLVSILSKNLYLPHPATEGHMCTQKWLNATETNKCFPYAPKADHKISNSKCLF